MNVGHLFFNIRTVRIRTNVFILFYIISSIQFEKNGKFILNNINVGINNSKYYLYVLNCCCINDNEFNFNFLNLWIKAKVSRTLPQFPAESVDTNSGTLCGSSPTFRSPSICCVLRIVDCAVLFSCRVQFVQTKCVFWFIQCNSLWWGGGGRYPVVVIFDVVLCVFTIDVVWDQTVGVVWNRTLKKHTLFTIDICNCLLVLGEEDGNTIWFSQRRNERTHALVSCLRSKKTLVSVCCGCLCVCVLSGKGFFLCLYYNGESPRAI